jgi:hypothetical protein
MKIRKFNESGDPDFLEDTKNIFANLVDEFSGSTVSPNGIDMVIVEIKFTQNIAQTDLYSVTSRVETLLYILKTIEDNLSLLAMNGDYYHTYRADNFSIGLYIKNHAAAGYSITKVNI